ARTVSLVSSLSMEPSPIEASEGMPFASRWDSAAGGCARLERRNRRNGVPRRRFPRVGRRSSSNAESVDADQCLGRVTAVLSAAGPHRPDTLYRPTYSVDNWSVKNHILPSNWRGTRRMAPPGGTRGTDLGGPRRVRSTSIPGSSDLGGHCDF